MAAVDTDGPLAIETEGLEADAVEDELEARHKQELKDLRATIQALKKSVPKGDKKKRKEVNDKISKLEKELSDKHLKEKEESHKTIGKLKEVKNVLESTEQEMVTNHQSSSLNGFQPQVKVEKASKAQRRREKREQEEREREERIKEASLNAGPNPRVIEENKLLSQLKTLHLGGIKEIIPDGNCLYAALGDQLESKFGTKLTVKELRRKCSDYMRCHRDEFMPFAVDHQTGELCEDYDQHCDEVENPEVWGGHLEIRALSRVFDVAVGVVQADLPVLWIGEEHLGNGVVHLTYHHHAYGLGEHYNSVKPLS